MVDKAYFRAFGYVVSLLLNMLNVILYIKAVLSPKPEEADRILDMKWLYITIWNMVIQGIYSAIGLFCEIPILLKMEKEHQIFSFIRSLRTVLFSGLFWPSGVFIFIGFWPIFLYDRELIYPAVVETALSPLSNYIMHGTILPIVIWELIFAEKRLSKPDTLTKSLMFLMIMGYNAIIFTSFFQTGRWPYPILNRLHGTIYFPLLYTYLLSFCTLSYYCQWYVSRAVGITEKCSQKVK